MFKPEIKLQTKITALFFGTLLVFVASIVGCVVMQNQEANQLQQIAAKESAANFKSIFKLESKTILDYVSEASTSPNTIELAKRRDISSAKNSFPSSAEKHGISQLLIFDAQGVSVFESQNSFLRSKISRQTLENQAQTILNLGIGKGTRYFWNGKTLCEQSFATIYENSEAESSKSKLGLFLCIRELNSAYTMRMRMLTSAEDARILRTDVLGKEAEPDSFSIEIPLHDINGKPAAYLILRDVSAAGALEKLSIMRASILLLLTLVLLLSISRIFVSKWAIQPIQAFSHGLKSNSMVPFSTYLSRNDEAGILARAIEKSFDHQAEIDIANENLHSVNEELLRLNESLEATVAERTQDLRNAVEQTLHGWSKALEAKDEETEGHTRRVAEMSIRMAQKLGLSASDQEAIYFGALLHDIGKIGIPDSILGKEGKLQDWEYEIMKSHTLLGYEILKNIEFLKDSTEIPLYHHEHWDGSGYPTGISGDSIPLFARLFAIADVWDALRSFRPYRIPWDEDQTRNYILEQSGTHFDPDLVKCFLETDPLDHPSDWFFKTGAA